MVWFRQLAFRRPLLTVSQIDGPSAGSKAAYIGGIQHAPADNGVNTLYVNVANCKNILWHWDIRGVGSSEYPVKGFNYFALDTKCQCSRLDLEFNSIAWGQDTGYGLVGPNGTVQN
ncbi:hypothetical protein LTR09_010839 [Extremus antarcticus]|uniref:NTF2-like domain-containing protein n=1 Tax=Extremus antarcticus TaxID=702011 RepID=A0AAJ0D6Y1_9PEZI|nr:hypothetical protein LTR09_010839 [Extremus antarcticus]